MCLNFSFTNMATVISPLPQLVHITSDKKSVVALRSCFLPAPISDNTGSKRFCNNIKRKKCRGDYYLTIVSAFKHVKDPSLDKNVVKQNKLRFVQKLKTLLLSKPKQFMHLNDLCKCRSYLAVSKPKSIISMIHRYPTIFELFWIPMPSKPLNATKPLTQLCVRLTPEATALAKKESKLKSDMAVYLAIKLQKLLMLSLHHRLLLAKLVHLAPDLGLPVDFRARLCNEHPERFKVVDTSYGRALELVSWDSHLAKRMPSPEVVKRDDLIVDRPLKFNRLRIRRKGFNVKRRHQEFLIKFEEFTDVCPYNTKVGDLVKESLRAEKRACDVVREVLGMTVEKRTLVDHLTHFRRDFGLPNKLRGLLVRHPELFYVSLKGQRDSVFLVEGYDDKGVLLERDATTVTKELLLDLVNEGKRMRRERRIKGDTTDRHIDLQQVEFDDADDEPDEYGDDLDNLFESDDDYGSGSNDDENQRDELFEIYKEGVFWTAEVDSSLGIENGRNLEPW
ncbi:protein WHAT'S THIS FACTOR 1 homolog, chloroplastic [Daucus carota subsp. sativus]|nr:PREDICTED: protein ROOT PRIMORDIUM DEFECTIVE 1-like [Daucus carota subsp. sativus]XP_017238482.1 PREDICTED: protein ROOT PRIMORDIUM DEFECTIVE 1-like [Daucus carota subsp. sativus]